MNAITETTGTELANMVPAHNIVATVVTSTAKLIGAGAIAKAEGKTIGHVKAAHAQRQGSSGVLHAVISGKNRAGTLAAMADGVLNTLVSHDGSIQYARAMKEITGPLSASVAYAYSESVRADGERIVKRTEWVTFGEWLTIESTKLGKTGKPTPVAKACADARKVWDTVQVLADERRAMVQAKLAN